MRFPGDDRADLRFAAPDARRPDFMPNAKPETSPLASAARQTGVLWNPSDYAANSAQQQGWARELIARLKLRGDERILDVGCGDGKVTAEIRSSPRSFNR